MNSELYGNQYQVPERILNKIRKELYKYPDSDGIKRAKNILNNPQITYQSLKRLKNFFDEYNPETTSTEQYELAGGSEMKDFVEQTLKSERDRTGRSKELMRPVMAGMGDSNLRAQNGQVDMSVTEGVDDGATDGALKKNTVVIIFNDEMKILLLKRSSYEDQWMPNKWALVGGKIEEGEDSLDAAKREVYEETGIKLNNLIEKFVLQKAVNNVEHMFVTKLPKIYSDNDIHLNFEHSDYGWFTPEEIKEMDNIVPHLLEYIKIAVENYE